MNINRNQAYSYTQDDLKSMSNAKFIKYLSQQYGQYHLQNTNSIKVDKNLQYSTSHERLFLNIKPKINYEYKKSSPIPELREKQKLRLIEIKQKKKNMRKLEFVKSEIEENRNIFVKQLLQKVKSMDIQNILWEKNYILKNFINNLKQENSGLKAKLWNISKENRKMKKQIESWNLQKTMIISPNKKPYIDSITMEKVFQDQQFSVVSMKIQINNLNEILQEKEQIIRQHQSKVQCFENNLEDLELEIDAAGRKLYNELRKNDTQKLDAKINLAHQKIKSKEIKIKQLQQRIQTTINKKNQYLYDLQHMEQPIRKYSEEQLNMMKQSAITIKQVQQEPDKILERQIKNYSERIENLEFEMQQTINECLVEKQDLKHKLRQLKRNIDKLQIS